MNKPWWYAACCVSAALLIVAATSACSPGLPGASGPRVVELQGSLQARGITGIALSTAPELTPGEWSQTFPSGTSHIYLVLTFAERPSQDLSINATVTSNSGKLDASSPADLMLNAVTFGSPGPGGQFNVVRHIGPGAGGWKDGAYQCRVNLGSGDIALVNWSVGGR